MSKINCVLCALVEEVPVCTAAARTAGMSSSNNGPCECEKPGVSSAGSPTSKQMTTRSLTRRVCFVYSYFLCSGVFVIQSLLALDNTIDDDCSIMLYFHIVRVLRISDQIRPIDSQAPPMIMMQILPAVRLRTACAPPPQKH